MKKFFRLNHQLNYPEVRVLNDKGEQIGVLPIDEAKKMAQDQDLDLVEISADAKPPVVKIIDFTKFRYLEEKKEKEAKKHAKATELKEIRFTPFIGEHDLQTGLEKVKKFLKDGDLVKISIRFKGAQMAHQEFGPKLLGRILENLDGIGIEDRQARMEGRQYVTIVKPATKAEKAKEETIGQEEKQNETKN